MAVESDDFFYFVIGMILAPIIDENELVGISIMKRHKYGLEFVIEGSDILFFIIGWDDNRECLHIVIIYLLGYTVIITSLFVIPGSDPGSRKFFLKQSFFLTFLCPQRKVNQRNSLLRTNR